MDGLQARGPVELRCGWESVPRGPELIDLVKAIICLSSLSSKGVARTDQTTVSHREGKPEDCSQSTQQGFSILCPSGSPMGEV